MNAVSSAGISDWVWQTMWNNSISTAVLVPVVLLLCRIFDRRPAVQNLLWLLLLVKFMTPQLPGFSWVIPESVVGSQWNQNSPFEEDPVRLGEETDWISPQRIVAPTHSGATGKSISYEESIGDVAIASEPTLIVSPLHLVSVTLGSVWFLGAGYFLVSIGYGLRNQRRILNRATDAGQRLLKTVSEVATQLGLRKLVPIQSSDIQSPFISCLGSVRLVWPTCLTTPDPSMHRSLIAHEAAHVRRCDHFVAWLELIATLVWWWNPLFWFVRRRLHTSAEMACDAMALEAFPEDRCFYAEKLLELSMGCKNGTQPLALAVGGDTPSSIERRLTMIVSERCSSKATLLGILIVSMFAIGAIPSWVFAQNVSNPPAPEPISSLFDPFMRRVPPPPKSTANQQGVTTAPVLSNEEKLVLRLKALYLVAISENRTTDAEALAAAISAMIQAKASAGTGAALDALDTGSVEPGMGNPGMMGSGRSAEPFGPGTVVGGAPAGIGGMTDGNVRDSNDQWTVRDHLPLRIKVTGINHGTVWGSNPYTDDSSLNAAAIHAGLVRDGQTADIVVIRHPGKESYRGSESHGVTTHEYGPWAGCFELAPVSQYADAPYLCDRSALRGNTDAYLTLNMLAGQAPLRPGVSLAILLEGQDGTPIVGTDDYTSDCNLDAAAVHAGVLRLGESGYVKIILGEGLDNYAGSNRNGVESFPYGKTKMSLRFEKLPFHFEKLPSSRSGDSLRSPTSRGEATGGSGEHGSPTGAHRPDLPPGAVPGSMGEPAGPVNPVGGTPEATGRIGDFELELESDRRANLGRQLSPRVNWQVERFNLPNAFSLGQLRPYQGLALRIKVTGKKDGPVWGSNAYTDDSSLNSAALHSRLVNAGETAEIVAIIRPGMKSYGGSYSNGIATNNFGPYPGSFQLVPVTQHPDAPYLCDRRALRGNNDAYLSLNMLAGQARLKPGVSLIVPLHGKSGAPIVGTDRYASDCNLDAAAVHAGVLKEGESGYVKIILEEGLESYSGSNRNGVESHPYGKTEMSLRFEKLSESESSEPVQIGFEDGK